MITFLAIVSSTVTTCHLQNGLKENIIKPSDITTFKLLTDNSDYPQNSKSELKETGTGVNLKPGESQLVVQLDESKAVTLASVTLVVPKSQESKLQKIEVLVQASLDKTKKPEKVVTLEGKDLVAKLPNLLEGIPKQISATELEIHLTTSEVVKIKLEIKACFHPKSTTTPHTTPAPSGNCKYLCNSFITTNATCMCTYFILF